MIDFIMSLAKIMLAIIAFKYVILLATRTIRNPLEWFKGVGGALYLIGVLIQMADFKYLNDQVGQAFWHVGLVVVVMPELLKILAPKIHRRLFKDF